MLQLKVVLWEIYYCIRHGVNPYRYFQINAPWFNTKKGIYSKLDIDQHIPERWRLPQDALDPDRRPQHYPVFVKPEWGQNSYGIHRIDNAADWQKTVPDLDSNIDYIVQQAAPGKLEYEVFYIREADQLERYSMLSVSQALNTSESDYPINSVINPQTRYQHCTDGFSATDLQALWDMLGSMSEFKIARVCCRCDSQEALLAGEFKIVEINLFVPMPLILMDRKISNKEKSTFLRQMADNFAKLVKTIPSNQPNKAIFLRKWALHRKLIK